MLANIMQITAELLLGFVALFLLTKLVGRTQMKQITPFDFISALVLGELLGNAIYDPEVNISLVLYALVVWGLLMFSIDKITEKVKKTRGILEGNPAIIIRNGAFDREQLHKIKMDLNQLQNLLRQQGVFSVREVEFGIIESNGALSVLKKTKYMPPTTEESGMPDKPVFLPVSLILDGEVLRDNLQAAGYDETWLSKQLSAKGFKCPEEVFFADWLEDDGLHAVEKKSDVGK